MKILQILIIIIFYTIFVNAQPIGWEDAAFGGGDTWDDDGEFGLIHFFLLIGSAWFIYALFRDG